jgi:hypothetical protein
MKGLAVVPGFHPPVVHSFGLIELLHALGEITTPPVPNYSDLSSTWAILRYIWAFELPPVGIINPLTLSATARALDFHQKGLLSDQIGVGMAALIMKRSFSMPAAIDVSLALNDPGWHLFQQTGRSPDYLFHDGTANGPVFVVECKGNQSGRSETIHQLQSGTEQVHSITFNNGRSSTALVIATWLKSESEVFIVDPPPDKPVDQGDSPRGSKAFQHSRRRWTVTDSERFSVELARVQSAQLLNFAGDVDAAVRVARIEVPGMLRPLQRETPVATRENQIGTFEGFESQVSLPDGTHLRAFRGVLREIRRHLLRHPEDLSAVARDSVVRQIKGIKIVEQPNDGDNSVSSVSDSGTMVELAIE